MERIVVTGGSGKAGRAVCAELSAAGYRVLDVDTVPPRHPEVEYLVADLTDLGEAEEALRDADAVVHLAAIPRPGLRTPEVTFRINTTSTYAVFSAAVHAGVERVVWASSETVIGLPFDREDPAYAPIDEAHPLRPESSYALSKVLAEEAARQFHRWSGIPFAGLRYSNVMEPHDYRAFPSYWEDPATRRWNLWGYVDAHDVGRATRLALEADVPGAEAYLIAAADTCMDVPSLDLMAAEYPEVEVRGEVPRHGTLLSIEKARERLGYQPQVSWRDYVEA